MIRKLAVVSVVVATSFAAVNAAQAAVSSNGSLPLGISVNVPCANGGAGETIVLSGELHMLTTATFDSSGGVHLTALFNPQDVSGIGTISGASYRGTGATVSTFDTNVAVVTTVVNNFLIVGAGSADTLRVHENIAVVIDANGVVEATVDNLSVTCG